MTAAACFSGKIRAYVAVALPLMFISAFLTETLIASRNTLKNNGHWISGKTLLESPMMGSGVFMTGTQALAKGRLNLGAWYGYQEVWYGGDIHPGRVQFDFQLEPGGWLALLLQSSPDTVLGVRFSNNPLYASIWFVMNRQGKFIQKHPLAPRELGAARHRFELNFNGATPEAAIDGLTVPLNGFSPGPVSKFGFKGSLKNAAVDNIKVWDEKGSLAVDEDFFDRSRWPVWFVAVFAGLCLLELAGIAVAARRWLPRKTIRRVVLYNNWLACLPMLGVCLLYVNVVAVRYPAKNQFGAEEQRWVQQEAEKVCKELDQKWDALGIEPARVVKILFLGTSQTHGTGASFVQEDFVNQVEQMLNARSGGATHVACFNGGIRGGRVSQILGLYESKWVKRGPDIVAVNLGFNDTSWEQAATFARILQQILDLNAEQRIQTLLVLEPASIEKVPHELALHREMRETAGRNNAPCLELHKLMLGRYDEGFLWWDSIHPTSFGHTLIAEYLAEALQPLVANVPASRNLRGQGNQP